jgi:hypothetical protein
LNREDNVELCRPFIEEEVHRVIRELKVSYAPGPDGFSYMFYKHCWVVIREVFMNIVQNFYRGVLEISRYYGTITLIPKVQDAFNVRQFRPICPLNVSFKIFTNLLMNIPEKVVDKLVDKGQTSFYQR